MYEKNENPVVEILSGNILINWILLWFNFSSVIYYNFLISFLKLSLKLLSGFHIRTLSMVGKKYDYFVERDFIPFKVFFYKKTMSSFLNIAFLVALSV